MGFAIYKPNLHLRNVQHSKQGGLSIQMKHWKEVKAFVLCNGELAKRAIKFMQMTDFLRCVTSVSCKTSATAVVTWIDFQIQPE